MLGKETGTMTQNRDGAEIRGQFIRHNDLQRFWVCGTCGAPLVTRCREGEWTTECAKDRNHPGSEFVTAKTWMYREQREARRNAGAQEVLAHLPTELRKEIERAYQGTD